jgi:N-acetylneuraminic acid mutarotase
MKYIFYKTLLSILFFTFLFLSCEETYESPYQKIIFEKKASMPGIGRSSAVGFAINGKGYVALGRNDLNMSTLKDCWEYDPANNSWTQKANFPGVARVKATGAAVDGKAYVGLGFDPAQGIFNSKAYLSDWWMYDPETDTWTKRTPFPGSGKIACMSYVLNGLIYVGAGYEGLSFTTELYAYDPVTNNWIGKRKLIGKPRSGSIACSDGKKVFFGTGFTAFDENDWYEYNGVYDLWKKRKSLPDSGRENAVALSVSNRFFVTTGRNFGGDLTGGHVKSDILEYVPEKTKWYKRGNIPSGERENAISFVIDNKAYIGFGENDTTVINDLWCFEP